MSNETIIGGGSTARCMKSDNVIKDNLVTTFAKEQIRQFTGTTQPQTQLSAFRYEHNPSWQDSDDIGNEAILPKITQRNQKPYLPPKKRSDTPINRGIAKIS